MSNNEQNGRQPPISMSSVPPTDPRNRTATTSEQQDGICRDFIWGICSKGVYCKYRHELNLESMKNILRFCHDFQNRSGCNRPGCTYLHTTNEEESLFMRTGQIPRVLRERYASMSIQTPSNNMYLDNLLMQPPPPPPPPPSVGTLPAASAHQPPPPLPTLLATPPPPPPPPPTPPPPSTVAPTPVQVTPPIFAAPPPVNPPAPYQTSKPPQPPLPLQLFDPSKPPPPLTPAPAAPKSGNLKRAAEPIEAGPSKARKQDGSKVEKSLCESCVQRNIRVELLHKEMKTLDCERKCQIFLYEKKTEAYENGKLLLKSAVSPELYGILDEYIESPSRTQPDAKSQYNQMPSLASGSSGMQKQVLLNMMELAKNIVEVGPRTNVLRNDTDWTIKALVEMARNANNNKQKSRPMVNGFTTMNGKINPTSTVAPTSRSVYVNTTKAMSKMTSAGAPSSAAPTVTVHPTISSVSSQNGPQSIPQNITSSVPQSLPQTHSPSLVNGHQQSLVQTLSRNSSHPQQQSLAQAQPQNSTHSQQQSLAQAQKSTRSQNKTHYLNANRAAHNQNPVHLHNGLNRNVTKPLSTTHLQNRARPQRMIQPQNVAHVQGATQSQKMPPAAAHPVASVPYQTAVQPPPRAYHPQYPSSPNNLSYTPYSPVRANTTPSAAKPTTSATLPQNTHSYSTEQYPQPHNYPPVQ